MVNFWRALPLLLVSLAGTPGRGRAQEAKSAPALEGAPGTPTQTMSAPVPTERMARLTFVAGDVHVERSDNTEVGKDAPVVNMPLTEGTRLVTGDYGQAEVEFEDGSVARLTPRSALGLDVLALSGDIARTQMTLLSGLAYFELRKAEGWEYRVDAGGAQSSPTDNLILRVSSVDAAPATFAVVSGSVRVEHPEAFRVNVKAGESLRLDANDASRYYLQDGIVEETWDSWNESRDRIAADDVDKQTTARDGFAGSQGYGWSDLDANGSWYQVAGEGQVWQPDVADEGFDPYGFGYWVWSGAGYSWASGYSWGWTPFRCGRWTFIKGLGWGWLPNQGCRTWGYGGAGVVPVTHGPPGYRQIAVPVHGPAKVHPIVAVLGLNGPRPRVLPGGPVKVPGGIALPLQPVGAGFARGGPVLGQALNRDFPIDVHTGRPILGGSGSGVGTSLEVGRVPDARRRGDQSVENSRSNGRSSRSESRSVTGNASGRSATEVERHDQHQEQSGRTLAPPSSPQGAPAVTQHPVLSAPSPVLLAPASVRAAPGVTAPIRVQPPSPAPVRTAPPAPAPVRAAPPPAPIAPIYSQPTINPKH